MTDRAAYVCDVCRKRKRTCDKRLPKCTYCWKNGRSCVYIDPAVDRQSSNNDKPNSRALLGRTSASSVEYSNASHAQEIALLISTQLSSISNQPCGTELFAAECVIFAQVCHYIDSSGRCADEVATAYFESLHRWLPVVESNSFKQRLASRHNAPLPIDFSLLLLAMSLATLENPLASTAPKLMGSHTLYFAVKTLFMQTQILVPQSPKVVQAGLIIAAFEYACRNVEAAYVTLRTCYAIARTCELDERKTEENEGGGTSEFKILWASIMILDRYVDFFFVGCLYTEQR